MLDQMSLELEPSFSGTFVTELERSDEASLRRPETGVAVRDMLLGAGGSAVAHVLAVIAALLLPFMQPKTTLQGAFCTVNLVALGEGRAGLCDTASLEGTSGGVPVEVPPPAEKQPERSPSPETPKPVKQLERVHAAKDKPAKTAPLPVPKPAANRVAPVTAVEEPAKPVSGSSGDTAAETLGTPGGKGEGTKGSGEGVGFPATGGTSGGGGGAGGEFSVDAVDKIPQALHKVEPVYPPRAHRQGVSGKVVLRFLVEPDGHTARPSVLEANPSGYFEQSALDAIRHWRFKPGLYRGRAVATWVVLPVQFKLTN